jgi:DNA-binding protein H-NS
MDHHLKSMSVDELWALWEEVSSVLARRIVEEKAKLEERLRLLENARDRISPKRPRGI